MSSKNTKFLRIMGLMSLVSVSGYVWAQGPFGPPGGGPPPGGPFGGGPFGGPPFGGPPGGGPQGGPQFEEEEENPAPLPASKVVIEERDGFRYMTANGIPDHVTGQFPQPGNPSRIQAQSYKFRMPLKPTVAEETLVRHDNVGVALNGVPFNAATNEFWNYNRAWNYEALSGKIYLGTDSSNAHVQPGGIYHYHGMPNGFILKTGKKRQMILIGYAADGFPMYARYGFTKADDPKSGVKRMQPSYRLKAGTRPSGQQGPGGSYDGTFSADWEYVKGAGDLDECNGRTGVTPEYPKGTYYYVVTDEYPFLPRVFRGKPDPSFNPNKPRPGQGPMPGNGMGAMSPGQPGFGPPQQ